MTEPAVNPPLRLLVAFETLVGEPPDFMLGVPGREMWVAGRPWLPGRWQFHVPDLEAQVLFTPHSLRRGRNAAGRPIPPWARYLAGVVRTLEDMALLPIQGAQLVVVADEPPGPRYEFALAMCLVVVCCDLTQTAVTSEQIVAWVERGTRGI